MGSAQCVHQPIRATRSLWAAPGRVLNQAAPASESEGKPIIAVLTGGERHEQIALEGLLDGGAIRRPAPRRPRLRPRRLAGDKGYSSPTARRRLRQRRISPVIPTRKDQRSQPTFDREAYRERNKVERLINRLKQFRRIATRYEKRAANYLAMVNIGMIMTGYSPLQTRPSRFASMMTQFERSGSLEFWLPRPSNQ